MRWTGSRALLSLPAVSLPPCTHPSPAVRRKHRLPRRPAPRGRHLGPTTTPGTRWACTGPHADPRGAADTSTRLERRKSAAAGADRPAPLTGRPSPPTHLLRRATSHSAPSSARNFLGAPPTRRRRSLRGRRTTPRRATFIGAQPTPGTPLRPGAAHDSTSCTLSRTPLHPGAACNLTSRTFLGAQPAPARTLSSRAHPLFARELSSRARILCSRASFLDPP